MSINRRRPAQITVELPVSPPVLTPALARVLLRILRKAHHAPTAQEELHTDARNSRAP
jgi:hypothetical protein